MSGVLAVLAQAGAAADSVSGLMGTLIAQIEELSDLEGRVIRTVVVLVMLLGLRWVVLFLVRRRTEDIRVRYYWRKTVTYIVGVVAIFAIGRVWFAGVGSLATFLGLVGAGVAIALKDPVTNLAAWLFILWRRPFRVGDRIEIGDDAGDVIDLRLFQFTPARDRQLGRCGSEHGPTRARTERARLHAARVELHTRLPLHLERDPGNGHVRE